MDTHAGAIDTGAGYVGAAMKRAGHNHGFEPLVRHGGYLPLEHFGLIGDGTTAALVGRDGTVAWLCLPRFDGDALFCSILDAEHGGGFRIAPADTVEARQRYEPDSGVLVTEMRSPTGLVHVVDCLTLRSGADLNEMSPLGAVSCSAPSPSSTAPSTWRSPWSRAAAPPPSGPARSSACARPRSRAWISTSPPPCPWTACARGSTCRSTTAPTSCSGGEAGLTAPTLRRCRRCWRERWRRGDAGRAQPSTRWSAASEPGTGCSPGICPNESSDGPAGDEGAFLLCSLWLVDNLAHQGRLEEAFELYESLCNRAGPLGLLPEEVDPSTGAFLGNHPQAFSHVGVISSGANLARLTACGG